MRAAIPKPIDHLYSIFKVYLGLAIGGALVVIGVQSLAARPFTILFSLITVVGIALGWFLLAASDKQKSDASEERRANAEAFARRRYEAFSHGAAAKRAMAKSTERTEKKWRKEK